MPESRSGGELVVAALEAAGVRSCFGVPGESFLAVLDALADSPVRFVSTRHEGAAAFMATGYARRSGELAVCLGTREVGTANLSIGVHNARQDSVGMLALAGQVPRALRHREAFQEVDLVAQMTPVAKWALELPATGRVPELMAKAVHVATSGRPGPVFVSMPEDVTEGRSDAPSWPAVPLERPSPSPAALEAVARALDRARRPLLFAGGGVAPAGTGALVALAEAAEVPVITGWRHHDAFPNDHRLYLGSAGLGAPPSVFERLAAADVVVVLGNRLQEHTTAGYALPSPAAELYAVDLEAAATLQHRPPRLALVADVASTLAGLCERVRRPQAEGRRAANEEDRRRFLAETAPPSVPRTTGGVSYEEVCAGLASRLPGDAVVTSDAGNFYAWIARYLRFGSGRHYVGPASGAMGFGLPAAIGAKLAEPWRPVVSVSGDGGFLMTATELETAVREDAPVVALVLDNARHGTIRMHQERAFPGRVVGTELGTTDLALVARGLGAFGALVEQPGQLAEALDEALSLGRPALVQVRMDRDQLSLEQRLAPS